MSTVALNHRILPLRLLTPPQSATVITPQFLLQSLHRKQNLYIVQSLSSSSYSSSSPRIHFNPSTRLYVSGLSFRTTDESLRNAFEKFGQLEEVNLVMDKIANRPRGFAFIRYATEEESKNAIEGMHGKFLDGRVIFVEVAKPRSESRGKLHQGIRRNP